MDDSERMTIGMWVDYIIEWNKLHAPKDKDEEERKATQSDFDLF